MKFHYQLTNQFRSAEFIERGDRPDLDQVISIDDKESDRDVRSLYEELATDSWKLQLPPQDKYLEAHEILPILEALKIKRKEDAVKAAENDAALKQRRMDRDAEENDRLKAKEEREDQESKKKELRAAEKMSWIEENGSAHLKKAAVNYNCHRLYLSERGAIELPLFVFDWDDNAQWGECACPTMEALNFLEALPDECQIVWIKCRHDADSDYDEDREDGEAIVYRNYLGSKYDLIRYL